MKVLVLGIGGGWGISECANVAPAVGGLQREGGGQGSTIVGSGAWA